MTGLLSKLERVRTTTLALMNPRNWHPAVWAAAVFLLTGILAMALTPVSPDDYRGEMDQEAIVKWVTGIVLLRVGVTATGIAFVGAVLRASAHNRPSLKRLDFAGKLLGVSAGTLAFLGAVLSVPYETVAQVLRVALTVVYSSFAVLGVLMFVMFGVLGIIMLRKRKRERTAAAQSRAESNH